MSTISDLADEYWQHFLDVHPTNGHLYGHYEYAGRFEDATRAAEDDDIAALREFARRADDVDETSLDEQGRITRAVLTADAVARADLLETRLAELAADPIFGPQQQVPVVVGMLALPDADVAEKLVDTYRGLGRHYRDLTFRLREGIAAGRALGGLRRHRDDRGDRPHPGLPARRGPAAAAGVAAGGLRCRCVAGAAESGHRLRRPARHGGVPGRVARRGPPGGTAR